MRHPFIGALRLSACRLRCPQVTPSARRTPAQGPRLGHVRERRISGALSTVRVTFVHRLDTDADTLRTLLSKSVVLLRVMVLRSQFMQAWGDCPLQLSSSFYVPALVSQRWRCLRRPRCRPRRRLSCDSTCSSDQEEEQV